MPDLGPPLSEAERFRLFTERMRRPNSAYSRETIERVRELIGLGATYKEIFERVEVTSMVSLRTLCSHHKMKTQRPVLGGGRVRIYSLEKVRALIEVGASYADIVESCGFRNYDAARTFVYRNRHLLGRVNGNDCGPLYPETVIKVWELLQHKHSIRWIGRHLGRSVGSIAGIVHRFDLRNVAVNPEIIRKKFEYRNGSRPLPRRPVAVVTAAGSVATPPRAPEPARYSIRGVSLAWV